MKKYSKLMAILLVFAMILAGVAQAAPVVEAEEVNSNVIRLSGADRIKTSVKISQTAYKDGAESVVIVGYEGEVDALAGTLLAHAKKGPVLFTKKGKLSEDTKTEIARLGAKNVYILGGTATIEDAVKTELETLKYTVKRISGSNREGTAAAVAKEVGGKTTHVFLARGYGDLRAVLSDALAVGPASAKGNMAVLLTRTDKVPAATLKSMKDLGVTNVTIVGGEVAVNSGVKTELETLKYTVDRLSGTTREGTAIAIANKYFAGKANALVANGYGSPDALVGGYLGAAIDAPILFSQANKVSEVTTDYLKANTEKAWILGGERVVNKEVLNKVLGAVVPTPTPPSTGGGSGGGSGDNVAVNTISVKPTELTLKVGDSGNITATVDPTNATNKNVTWSSNDEEVATVDANGEVTAVGVGTATITATSNNGKTATTTVTVVAENTVAMIGTVYYETLDAALAAAVDGDTVTLLNDITLDSTLLIDKAVTIDGNGYSVNQAIYITKDEVTIKNLTGTIVPREEHKISGIGGQSAFVVSADKVVLDNITVDGKSEANSAAVRGLLDAQFEVINSNISNVQTGIFAHHGNTAPEAGQNVLIVTGNTFTDVWAGIGGTEKTDLTATGNTFVSIQAGGEGIGLGNGVVVIGADTEDDVNYLETKNTFNYSEGNKVVDYRSAVANISQGKYYDTVQAAIDDAAAGDEIIVGDGDYKEELTINKAITLKSLNGSESTKIAGTITIVPLDDEKLQDVTVEGFTVTAPTGYKAYPVIHMNNLENVNILNNSVVADDTAYGAIGTQDGPAKVTGKISGNTVTGMIMVGTDGAVEVSNNNVTLTTASTEGICFYPVGPAAEITVTGNTVGQVTGDNVHIKVNEKPLSVNGETNEVDMLAAITAGNDGATAKLGWFTLEGSTVAVIGAMQYDSLQAAITNALAGDTILLVKDIEVEGQLFIRKNITIDGNSKTITSTASEASKHSAIKIDSLGSGTTIQNLTVNASGYTGDVLYVSTATDVKITGNTFESTDNLAMGVYFDRSSSGELTNNVIVGRKGVGADTLKNVTITGNEITFTNMGIELHDGLNPRVNTTVINDSSEETDEEVHVFEQYTVSGNTFNKVTK